MPTGSRVGGDEKAAAVAALNVVWPAGVAAGDIAVVISGHSNASTTTTPTGFTSIKTTATNAAFGECYVKVCSGSETGNLAVNISTASKHEASLEVWRNVVAPTASEVTIQLGTSDAATTSAVPAVTTSATPTWWFTHTVQANSTPPTSFTAPAGTTRVADGINTGSGAKCGSTAYANASETDLSVGSGSWTRVGGSGNIDWANFTVALANSFTRISKTTATTWDTRARVAKTTATTYDVRTRVAKTSATTWDVAGALTRISKTTATTWDVAAALTRISKTTATTWNMRARVAKTTATTWNTRARVSKTTATTWNLASMISQANWPAFIGHRGSDPGPEETLPAYDTLWGRSPSYWHEGDLQVLNDGTTMVASHDDTIDRMYSSGPVSTGNISTMSPAQWTSTFLRINTGFTGSAQHAMFLSDWNGKYGGGGTSGPAIGLWECKTGTDINDCIAGLAGQIGTVVLNCNSLADAQAAVAAGFSTCYQTDTPTFSQFTSNGIKYLSINFTAMTGTIATNAIAAGVKVLMYTVNSTANRDSMLALFSDTDYAGFISNKPQTLAGTTRISKTTATTWNTRTRVAKTTATTWNTRARVSKTTSTTYDVRTRLAKTTATTWDARARVPKSTATTWNLRARVAKSTSTTWDTAGALTRISKTLATTWNVRARVPKTTATTYNVRARVGKATSTSWDTRARLAKTQGTTYDVRARVGKTTGTTWGVRERVVVIRTATWDVASVVDPGTSLGRILHARLRIDGARGELRIPTARGHARIPAARGELR